MTKKQEKKPKSKGYIDLKSYYKLRKTMDKILKNKLD